MKGQIFMKLCKEYLSVNNFKGGVSFFDIYYQSKNVLDNVFYKANLNPWL